MCHGSAPLLEQVISDEEVLTVIRIIVETGQIGITCWGWGTAAPLSEVCSQALCPSTAVIHF